jgi:hypothetical protein
VCEASYNVSYHIAHCGEVHTIAENLVIPCVKDIVLCVLGDNHLKVIKVPLPTSTVSRTEDMSCNIKCELIKWTKSFAMQVVESTGITGICCLHL